MHAFARAPSLGGGHGFVEPAHDQLIHHFLQGQRLWIRLVFGKFNHYRSDLRSGLSSMRSNTSTSMGSSSVSTTKLAINSSASVSFMHFPIATRRPSAYSM